MELLFASGNEHKKKEMEALLPGHRLILPRELGLDFDPVEDGSSFVENALIKAEELWRLTGRPCIADDSGLCVDAFGGKPGIHTARYGEEEAGRPLSAREKYMLLLRNMEGIENRKATFVCCMVLMLDENRKYIIQEDCPGKIALAPEGLGGFGYDPVFYNDEAGKISGLLTEEEKNTYSHRAKAAMSMKKLMDILEV